MGTKTLPVPLICADADAVGQLLRSRVMGDTESVTLCTLPLFSVQKVNQVVNTDPGPIPIDATAPTILLGGHHRITTVPLIIHRQSRWIIKDQLG